MQRLLLVLLVLSLFASACSGDGDDAEVLGVVLERSPSETTAPEPTTAPAPTDDSPEPDPSPEPVSETEQPGEQVDTGTPVPVGEEQDEEPEPEPEPEPTPEAWVVPDGHQGESGVVWIVLEEDDGSGSPSRYWTDTSSTSVDRPKAGAPSTNPLRVTLPGDGTPEDAEREAVCSGGLYADDEVAIEARGTIRLSLFVDGERVARSRTEVDVVLQPGSGVAAAELAGPVTVALSDTSRVECVVTFSR